MSSRSNFALDFNQTDVRSGGAHSNASSQQPANGGGGGVGTGTVTSVATGNGLTGGPITTTGTIKMAVGTALSQKWRWSGTTPGGGSPDWQHLSDGYIYPEDYGAVGDGTTDDSVALQDAATAAAAAGAALFLSKNYGYGTANSSHPLTVTCAIESNGAATLSAVGGQVNGILISGANNLRFRLPIINGFSGYGVRFANNGATNCGTNWFESIQIEGCGIGVDFYSGGSGSSLDNSGRVTWLVSCTTAIRCYLGTDTGGPITQGNNVDSNFVLNCNSWVTFAIGGGVTNTNINDNTFTCDAFDAGTIGSVLAINNQTGLGMNQNKFICRTFWGGFVAGDYWLYSPTKALEECDYEFGTGTAFAGTTAQQYAMVSNAEYIYAWGSSYRIAYGSKMPNNAGIAASTTSNARSTFNGGNAIPYNRVLITMAVAGLGAGSTLTFYVYHAFAQGNCRCRLEPDPVGGSMNGCIVDSITDNYGTHANEIAIVIRNVGSISLTATVSATLVVGIP